MLIKFVFLIVFFAVMIGVGLYSRRHATNVNDFVLGGRAMEIVAKDMYDTTVLKEEDVVEVVSFMGGG